MWTLRALVLILTCSGLRCDDCNKTKLYFISRNFYNVLHWDGVPDPGQDVLYSVQYKKYGESVWTPMTECQNISITSCDLSPVMTDAYEKYYAKVTVDGMCVGEYFAFVPSKKTVLGAPEVSVRLGDSSLTLIITTPTAPLNRSITEISRNHIKYEVQLTHPASTAEKKYESSSGVITLSSLEPNTEYCGTVFYNWTHPSNLRMSENTTFCTMIPGKPWIHLITVPVLLAVLLLIFVLLVLCQQYVMRKQRLPDILKKMIPRSDTPPYFMDPEVRFDIARIYSESPRKFDNPDPGLSSSVERPKVESNGGSSYAAQDCCGEIPLESNSYANQHVALVENSDPSNVSATSYGMVVTSLVSKDLEEAPDSPNSSGLGDSIDSEMLGPISLCTGGRDEPWLDLNRGSELEEKDFGNEAVVLPVFRDEGGKLEFVDTSVLMANSLDIRQVASRLPPAGERTPLLADLVTADDTESPDGGFPSDYGRAYHSNYVQQNFPEISCTDAVPLASLPDCTSNYRQNWILGLPLEPHLSSTDYFANNEPLNELDEDNKDNLEEEDLLSTLGVIRLDGWVVEIQT